MAQRMAPGCLSLSRECRRVQCAHVNCGGMQLMTEAAETRFTRHGRRNRKWPSADTGHCTLAPQRLQSDSDHIARKKTATVHMCAPSATRFRRPRGVAATLACALAAISSELCVEVQALDNGLGATPALGWSSWSPGLLSVCTCAPMGGAGWEARLAAGAGSSAGP